MSKEKVALITGITGQDGSYLAEFLIEKGYMVHGMIRRATTFNTVRIAHLPKSGKLKLHIGDLTDAAAVIDIVIKTKPDEIYNLGAQSHVGVSFQCPQYTGDVNGLGCLRVMDAMRTAGIADTCKFYQASTCDMWGRGCTEQDPATETKPCQPISPYGVSKLYAHYMVRNYRESYGMKVYTGVFFNHESPRRGDEFVTRKITKTVAKIKLGIVDHLELGNMEAKRDWGDAKDYVRAAWMILQSDTPDDYLISTGVARRVRNFVEAAFKVIGEDIVWEGQGLDEVGKDKNSGKVRVKINPAFFRPSEKNKESVIVGDSTKLREALGWTPEISFQDTVKNMVETDIVVMGKDPNAF